MKRRPALASITKSEATLLFQRIDTALTQKNQRAHIVLLGGLAIILQGFRERSTLDIDIAPTPDAALFVSICRSLDIPVDVITIATTVDLLHASTVNQFTGRSLTVDAINPLDLIKLKLERFYKQDPEDISAIIDAIQLPYKQFVKMVSDMLIDFIGNPQGLVLSARDVVERKYPEHFEGFVRTIP